MMKTEQNGHGRRMMGIMEEVAIPFEEWSAAQIREKLPIYHLESFAPARTMDDEMFGTANGGTIGGGVFFPRGGYVNDPQLATYISSAPPKPKVRPSASMPK
ncbi:MAG: hypothetical protein R3C97_17155 [Geminicoccaceae bacterium]